MYSTRGALGLLWRAATNYPDTARVWSDGEMACARKLQDAGLVNVHYRTGKDGEQEFSVMATERGKDAFEAVLDAMHTLIGGASVVEVFGETAESGPQLHELPLLATKPQS